MSCTSSHTRSSLHTNMMGAPGQFHAPCHATQRACTRCERSHVAQATPHMPQLHLHHPPSSLPGILSRHLVLGALLRNARADLPRAGNVRLSAICQNTGNRADDAQLHPPAAVSLGRVQFPAAPLLSRIR